jgi:RHS repeat-associated protein
VEACEFNAGQVQIGLGIGNGVADLLGFQNLSSALGSGESSPGSFGSIRNDHKTWGFLAALRIPGGSAVKPCSAFETYQIHTLPGACDLAGVHWHWQDTYEFNYQENKWRPESQENSVSFTSAWNWPESPEAAESKPTACPAVSWLTCEIAHREGVKNNYEELQLSVVLSQAEQLGFPAKGLESYNTTTEAITPLKQQSEIGTPLKTSALPAMPVSVAFFIACENTASLLRGVEGLGVPCPFAPSAQSEAWGMGNPAMPDRHECFLGKPVDCATGNEVMTHTDLSVGGRGPALALALTYNSGLAIHQLQPGAAAPGAFGYGWTSSYSAHLQVAVESESGFATVYQDNGSTVALAKSGESWTALNKAVEATLASEGSGYVYTLPDQATLHFNSAGQLTSETDRNGNSLTMSRNAEGRLEAIKDTVGREITLKYNSEGKVESASDPMGHTVKYAHEGGNLASVTEPGETSARWQFKYSAAHELTSQTDGRGNVTTSEYDASGRVVSQTDPLKHTRKWGYTASTSGAETTMTEPSGMTTVESFNEYGSPTTVTHAVGTSLASTASNTYNTADELVASTDPDGHTTTYTYDSSGDMTSEKDADGDEKKWTYDGKHDIETETTPEGETTTIKRNSKGDPEAIERPAPGSTTQKTTYKYASNGDVESMTNPLERTWKYEYDSYGDRKSEADPEGDKRTWEYNEDSQETATVSPRGNITGGKPAEFTTKIELDAQGRPLTVTDPLKHTAKYKYDGDGNVEKLTDGNSHTTTYTYNADNQQTKVEAPNKAITETEYDSAGQVVKQIDGNKHATEYKRNALEEVTEVVDPLKRKTTKEYDAAGNLVKVTDPKGRTTTYTYDPANRLTEVSYSSGTPATIKYEYNKDGDRTKMTDGTGATTYTYDQLGRQTEAENGHGEVSKYEYDLANDETKITYPNKKAVTRAFDKDGRLEKITDWNGKEAKFAYNEDSDLKTTTFPSETKDEDKNTYNDADQMTEAKMLKSTETLASLVYTRDSDGQVKKTTAKSLPGSEVTEATYDENNRVTKYGSTEYKYDAANNPTKEASSTNTYNEGDELEKGTGVTYAYDELGERIKATPEKGGASTYGYDQAGNLVSVERPEKESIPKIEDTYAYNGEGLRTSQTISGTTSYFAWDLTEGLPLILSDSTNSYIYGPGGLPMEQINTTTGAVTYLHHDQAGSTRLLTGSTGTVTGKCTYGAYGTPTCEGSATTPLGYDGQYTSSDTGLIYMRNRVYDPSTAQFLTVDPLNKLTQAPYNYANDNPLNESDSEGLFSVETILSGLSTVATVGVCLTPGVDVVACGPAIAINAGVQSVVVLASSRSSGEKAALVLANGVLAGGSAALSGAAELAAEQGAPGGILSYLRAAGTLVPSLPGLLEPEPKTGNECG